MRGMPASYELIQLGEQSYYIDCPSKIGIYRRNDRKVYLIDSGIDCGAAEKAMQIIKANSWELCGIINTHSHADHIGGNAYLQRNTGCDVFVPEKEMPFVKYPEMEPMALMGAMPPEEMTHRLLKAEPSEPKSISDEAFPKELEAIRLPGHSYDMIGVKTPDGTFYAADSVSNPHGLEKYRITYIYDVKKYLETLENMKGIEAKIFVPSHTGVTKDISEIADFNKKWVLKNIEDIRLLIRCGADIGEIVKGFFDKYSLKISYEQYFIVQATLLSYLTYLKNEGRVESYFEENRLIYKAI